MERRAVTEVAAARVRRRGAPSAAISSRTLKGLPRTALRARSEQSVIEPWGGGKWHLEVFRSGAAEPEEWNGEL